MDVLAMMRESPGQPDILSRLRAIFAESLQLNLREDELRGVTRLSEIAGVDSMAAVVFVAAVEEEFHIVIEPERLELDFIEDLPRLAAYVEACGEAGYKP
jgi:acyl carrier protein